MRPSPGAASGKSLDAQGVRTLLRPGTGALRLSLHLPVTHYEPAHIHVAKAGKDAKFWLSPVRRAVNHGFRPHDLKEIARIIEENEPFIMEKWNEFFRP
jgi:hypothetical protein